MIKIIAQKEIRELLRSKKCRLAILLLTILFVISVITSAINQQRLNHERNQAQQRSRTAWLEQSPKNPHSAAHFGNFAFRLKTPLSLFDKGLDAYTGSQVFLEPHKQDDFKFTEAEDSGTLIRFGELTPAFILQTVLPLLIIFLFFDAVSKEKEDQTLKMLVGNGTSLRQIVAGKIAGYWLVLTVLLSVLAFAAFILMPARPGSGDLSRFMVMLLTYALYAGVTTTIAVVISAFSHTSRASLMKLLSLWMLATIILPKITSSTGSTLYTTPSQFEYNSLVKHDEENGLNGHDPHDKRRQLLLEQTLAKYQVDTITKLPVNFDAIAMVESEQYTTKVYRKRIGEIRQLFHQQNRISMLASFINPFQATQYTSMALCGTDYAHFINFQDAAEAYRLYFVNAMNQFMAEHTKSGDWTTKFGADTYQLVAPFRYTSPGPGWSITQQPIAFIALLTWFLLSFLLIYSTGKIKIA